MFWKALDNSQKFCKGLTQWDFLPLGTTFIYTTENLPTLTTKTNWTNLGILTWSKSINWWQQVESHNGHPFHDLSRTCGGSKYVCKIWIGPTHNLLAHLSTSIRINGNWSSKYNKHNSKSTKTVLNKETEGDFKSSKAIN